MEEWCVTRPELRGGRRTRSTTRRQTVKWIRKR